MRPHRSFLPMTNHDDKSSRILEFRCSRYLSFDRLQTVHHIVRVQRKRQHFEHHHNKSCIVLRMKTPEREVASPPCPQPCGAFAMRSRALPVNSMIRDEVQLDTPGFPLTCHCFVTQHIRTAFLHSPRPSTAPDRWLLRKLSSRSSNWLMLCLLRPICLASPRTRVSTTCPSCCASRPPCWSARSSCVILV